VPWATAAGPVRKNYTPGAAPKMFPYAAGESQSPAETEAKRF
jgi:hypothetical protein